jgi:hypothetical protein
MVKEQNSEMKFRLPKDLKEEFDKLSEAQGVASSAMLRGVMASVVQAWHAADTGKVKFAVGAENQQGKKCDIYEIPVGRWS